MRTKMAFFLPIFVYLLFGSLSGAMAGTCDTKEDASAVEVIRGVETTGINLTLRMGGSITGQVYEADGISAIKGAWVSAYELDWTYIGGDDSDERGRYDLTGLRAGQYYVVAEQWSPRYECRYYDDSETREGAIAVGVVEGVEAAGIDFRLPALRGQGSISGHVYESDGVTPAGSVTLVASELWGWGAGGTSSDPNGHYTMMGLEPGEYCVRAGGEWQWEYITRYYDGAGTEEEATPVHVSADSDTPGIDFQLPRWPASEKGSISGHVYEMDGQTPVPSANVRASLEPGVIVMCSWATAGAGGEYRIEGLPQGLYYVWARPGSGYIPQYYEASLTPNGALRVTVAGGEDTPGIDFRVPLGGSICGRVYEADGRTPIAQPVRVRAHDMNWWSPAADSLGFGTEVDGNGYYRIAGLDTGRYYIQAGNLSDYLPGYFSFRIRTPRVSPEGILLQWMGEEGRSYKILASTDLMTWDELPPTISGAAGQAFTEWRDSDGPTFPRRFYKVKQFQ